MVSVGVFLGVLALCLVFLGVCAVVVVWLLLKAEAREDTPDPLSDALLQRLLDDIAKAKKD